jgi:hypothetical protein
VVRLRSAVYRDRQTSRAYPAAVCFANMPLPTLEYRTQTLLKIQEQRTRLVRAYAISSWSYSFTGFFYLFARSRLPASYCTTPLMGGAVFGSLLVLQGIFSYINDAVTTFGGIVWPGRRFYLTCDRICAVTNFLTTLGCIWTWPSTGKDDARYIVSMALGCTCVVAFPVSRFCELTGRMLPFLCWHAIWHYVPNVLAVIWMSLSILTQ